MARGPSTTEPWRGDSAIPASSSLLCQAYWRPSCFKQRGEQNSHYIVANGLQACGLFTAMQTADLQRKLKPRSKRARRILERREPKLVCALAE